MGTRTMSIQTDFPGLLRRSRGSGCRLSMLPRGWGRACGSCFLLLLHLFVMFFVLRGALVRLSGLGLRPIRRAGGAAATGAPGAPPRTQQVLGNLATIVPGAEQGTVTHYDAMPVIDIFTDVEGTAFG